MSKQTAVEWLVEKYELVGVLTLPMIERAKAMEREQMIDAYSNGWHDGQDIILQQCKHIDKGGDDAGTQYYNETFKGGEK